ncbi:hydroxymethylbilane synthase [Bacillus pseudomycoides]|uniref:Porphobilinogen deaminase n=1 Tax=Bacillus pseudomycoides TaxID=64104 RepID=A0A1S9X0J1_9BACI|nr:MULTISPECIES: hydroxymethylbilane synthase [Bacillus]EOP49810.1 porphobilinogen deaminase [Bacillus cereus VD136]EOP65582.1 porphobilinogen deaminase [Bacillus cereus VDM006]EOQ02349.1 porphobilinogen deaminase [Bacillus cereus VDM021]EEM03835.1 Porphobilinogen deaminase [Bacillus pseudomycoides]EEM09417.1 Porphobilinogen deaminase [Bacillus pseudomycoides]
MRKIIVGSRKSKLALTQTNWFIDQLKALGLPYEFEVKEIVTKGDVILDVTLSKVGGKGLFVKEIEHALLMKEIDMAVHSMKDMPAVLPDGLTIGCIPKRVDPRDAFISKNGESFEDLAEGAILGTSSLRRSAQLLAARPDLQVKWIRGNIDTRLRKLKEEDYDAIILATAGLQRMGWDDDVITEHLDETLCVPAVGQGALAIECREDDADLLQLLSHMNDAVTERTVAAERVFLHKLEGGCQVPIAGYATLQKNDEIELTALVGSMDGSVLLKEIVTGVNPEQVGLEAADRLIKQGAKELILAANKEQH